MIKKVVLYSSGIINKQATIYKQVNGFNVYRLTEDITAFDKNYTDEEDRDLYFKYQQIFIELNNYLFPLGDMRHIDKLNNFKSEKEVLDAFSEQVSKSLSNGRRPSLGLCQYFNRMDTYNKAVELLSKKKEQELEERIKKESELKLKEEMLKAQKLNESSVLFLRGGKIEGDVFVDLCDKVEVKLPLRTRGWLLNKVYWVSTTQYSADSDSSVIFDYIDKLELKLKARGG